MRLLILIIIKTHLVTVFKENFEACAAHGVQHGPQLVDVEQAPDISDGLFLELVHQKEVGCNHQLECLVRRPDETSQIQLGAVRVTAKDLF